MDTLRRELNDFNAEENRLLSLSEVEFEKNETILKISFIVLIVLAVGWSVVIYRFFNRAVLSPIYRLTDAAATLGSKYNYKPIPTEGNDEVAVLVNAFNKMQQDIVARTNSLKESKEEAEELARVKSDFLANMSHELRTPLNAVVGFSEMIEIGLAKDHDRDSLDDYAMKIRGSGMHLLRLINNILDLSKIQADQFELENVHFSLSEELQNFPSAFQAQAEENHVTIETNFHTANYNLYGDATRFRQVLYNLLSNAIKFGQGGKVSLSSTVE